MNWRKTLRSLHRDLGFLCVGLTLVYAISGVAVNHIHQWNPNYAFHYEEAELGPVPAEQSVAWVLDKIGDASKFKSSFRRDPRTLEIFTELSTIKIDLPTGHAVMERGRERPFLFPLNYLHLNHPKGSWTWVADTYAVLLAFLAVSGLFIVKGRRGLRGRGGLLTAIGVALPLLLLFYYR